MEHEHSSHSAAAGSECGSRNSLRRGKRQIEGEERGLRQQLRLRLRVKRRLLWLMTRVQRWVGRSVERLCDGVIGQWQDCGVEAS